MRSTPGALFFSTFNPEVVRILLRALDRAYQTTCDNHASDRGANEQMFGFSLYGYNVHEQCKAASESGGLILVKSRNPTFRLQIGEYEVACHRVGHRATEDIERSFPKNEGAVHKMAEVQLWLSGVDLGLDTARKVVLAHLGNEEDGLEAAYICFPGTVKKRRIESWAYTHPLYIRGVDLPEKPQIIALPSTGAAAPLTGAATSAPANDTLAPEEQIEERKLRRRVKKDERDGGQGAK